MRNFYLLADALRVGSIAALENGISNINNILLNRDGNRDFFLCTDSVWECDTTQGLIYEMSYSIVSPEMQRIIPFVFSTFQSRVDQYNSHTQLDQVFPNDCNAFTGFAFGHTTILADRQIPNRVTYNTFVNKCLKYGAINNTVELQENLTRLYPRFVFDQRALDEILEWKNSDARLYDRLYELFDDIPENPFVGGIGETEVLKYMGGLQSKRINLPNRVTYRYSEDEIRVYACSGHYN